MRQIKAVIRYNFMGFYKKPKVILTFLLGFILCFLLSSRIMPVIQAYKSPVQMLEPFFVDLWRYNGNSFKLRTSFAFVFRPSCIERYYPVLPVPHHKKCAGFSDSFFMWRPYLGFTRFLCWELP